MKTMKPCCGNCKLWKVDPNKRQPPPPFQTIGKCTWAEKNLPESVWKNYPDALLEMYESGGKNCLFFALLYNMMDHVILPKKRKGK